MTTSRGEVTTAPIMPPAPPASRWCQLSRRCRSLMVRVRCVTLYFTDHSLGLGASATDTILAPPLLVLNAMTVMLTCVVIAENLYLASVLSVLKYTTTYVI